MLHAEGHAAHELAVGTQRRIFVPDGDQETFADVLLEYLAVDVGKGKEKGKKGEYERLSYGMFSE